MDEETAPDRRVTRPGWPAVLSGILHALTLLIALWALHAAQEANELTAETADRNALLEYDALRLEVRHVLREVRGVQDSVSAAFMECLTRDDTPTEYRERYARWWAESRGVADSLQSLEQSVDTLPITTNVVARLLVGRNHAALLELRRATRRLAQDVGYCFAETDTLDAAAVVEAPPTRQP